MRPLPEGRTTKGAPKRQDRLHRAHSHRLPPVHKKMASTGVRRHRRGHGGYRGAVGLGGLPSPRQDRSYDVISASSNYRMRFQLAGVRQGRREVALQRRSRGGNRRSPRRESTAITASGVIVREERVEAHQRCAHVIAMGLAWCFDASSSSLRLPRRHTRRGFLFERGQHERRGNRRNQEEGFSQAYVVDPFLHAATQRSLGHRRPKGNATVGDETEMGMAG